MNLTNLQRLIGLLAAAGMNPVGTLLTADPNGELKLSFVQSVSPNLHDALLRQGWVVQTSNCNSYNYRPE